MHRGYYYDVLHDCIHRDEGRIPVPDLSNGLPSQVGNSHDDDARCRSTTTRNQQARASHGAYGFLRRAAGEQGGLLHNAVTNRSDQGTSLTTTVPEQSWLLKLRLMCVVTDIFFLKILVYHVIRDCRRDESRT